VWDVGCLCHIVLTWHSKLDLTYARGIVTRLINRHRRSYLPLAIEFGVLIVIILLREQIVKHITVQIPRRNKFKELRKLQIYVQYLTQNYSRNSWDWSICPGTCSMIYIIPRINTTTINCGTLIQRKPLSSKKLIFSILRYTIAITSMYCTYVYT